MTIATQAATESSQFEPRYERGFATIGSPYGRLLSGAEGREDLPAHEQRLGELPTLIDPLSVLDIVRDAHLVGRGGAEFPLARKLNTARSASGEPTIVVNGSESEPASRKDRLLLQLRPHLVLDGAQLVATAVGARQIVVYLHGDQTGTRASLVAAIRERNPDGQASVFVHSGPTGFVTGESSAVVAALEGGHAVPRPHAEPVAVRGLRGRPTVVSNVETLAHLALAFRFGAAWFRSLGSHDAPGSTLLTLAGGVATPGLVVESLHPSTFRELLTNFGGLPRAPHAVLLGGYGGRWVSGAAAWGSAIDRATLKRVGVPLGCGLVAPLPHDACGLEVTSTLLDFLSRQSAGQCGSCLFGLPRISTLFRAVVQEGGTRADIRQLRELSHTVEGRGGCAHPDGAVALLETALEVFKDDMRAHLKGHHCGQPAKGWFPLVPIAEGGSQG